MSKILFYNLLIFSSCLLFLSSCSTQLFKRPAIKSPLSVQNLYKKGLWQKKHGHFSQAILSFSQVTDSFPGSDLADDASIEIGHIYNKKQNFSKAYQHYLKVIQSSFESDREIEALLYASRALFHMNQLEKAFKLNQKLINKSGLSKKESLLAHRLSLLLLTQIQHPLEKLKTLVYLSIEDTSPENRSQYRLQAIELTESKLTDSQREDVSSNSDYSFIRPYAMLQLGHNYIEKQNTSLARYYLNKVIVLLPESDLSEEASQLIFQINSLKKTSSYTIGAILPLTGKHAKIAKKTLKGLQLGLGLYDNNPSQFKLAVIDSEGNPDVARKAVERLVQEDHVVAIVGSLLSKTSLAVASKAHELGVPSIALSQKSNVTEVGRSVFRNATTSHMQVKHLVRTAMEEMKLKRFAILYPNDNYGTEYASLFWDEVLARGGEIRGAVSYNPKETDFRSHIQRLVGTFYIEDRLPEYKIRLREWTESQTRRTLRKNIPNDILPPVVDFEALFIPDSVKTLGQVAPMLAYNDVENLSLLGTNLWHTSSLPKRAGRFSQLTIFIGGALVSEQTKQTSLYKDFSRVFKTSPGTFEIQAYDSAVLLRQLITSGATSRTDLKEKLSSLKIFPGFIKNLSISAKREVIRPLVTLTVDNNDITEFDPENYLKKQRDEDSN